jgi:hypothetical protein
MDMLDDKKTSLQGIFNQVSARDTYKCVGDDKNNLKRINNE